MYVCINTTMTSVHRVHPSTGQRARSAVEGAAHQRIIDIEGHVIVNTRKDSHIYRNQLGKHTNTWGWRSPCWDGSQLILTHHWPSPSVTCLCESPTSFCIPVKTHILGIFITGHKSVSFHTHGSNFRCWLTLIVSSCNHHFVILPDRHRAYVMLCP